MNARAQLSTPLVIEAGGLDQMQRQEMYALYERYYEASSYAQFEGDLTNKDRVLMLRGRQGELQGFSTLAVYDRQIDAQRLRVLFSGDTIIDQRHWGSQAFAFAWLRLAGVLKAQLPHTPLYWFLISKGHRTYRYLPAFSHEFFPMPDRTVPGAMQALMDCLAHERFGDAYDASSGLLRFAQSQGHLRPRFAAIPAHHLRLPEVRYFLQRNPGYAHGDELVCLCELKVENLKPLARRVFAAGSASVEQV